MPAPVESTDVPPVLVGTGAISWSFNGIDQLFDTEYVWNEDDEQAALVAWCKIIPARTMSLISNFANNPVSERSVNLAQNDAVAQLGYRNEVDNTSIRLDSVILADGAWHWVAGVIRPDISLLRVDNQTTQKNLEGGGHFNSGSPFLIGASYTDNLTAYRYLFEGLMSDIRIYDRSLSDAELDALKGNETGAPDYPDDPVWNGPITTPLVLPYPVVPDFTTEKRSDECGRQTVFSVESATKMPSDSRRYIWSFANELQPNDAIQRVFFDGGGLNVSGAEIIENGTMVIARVSSGTINNEYVVTPTAETKDGDSISIRTKFFVSIS